MVTGKLDITVRHKSSASGNTGRHTIGADSVEAGRLTSWSLAEAVKTVGRDLTRLFPTTVRAGPLPVNTSTCLMRYETHHERAA